MKNLKDFEKEQINKREAIKDSIAEMLIDNGFDGKPNGQYQFASVLGFVVSVELGLVTAKVSYEFIREEDDDDFDDFDDEILHKIVPIEDVLRESESVVRELLEGSNPYEGNCFAVQNYCINTGREASTPVSV